MSPTVLTVASETKIVISIAMNEPALEYAPFVHVLGHPSFTQRGFALDHGTLEPLTQLELQVAEMHVSAVEP